MNAVETEDGSSKGRGIIWNSYMKWAKRQGNVLSYWRLQVGLHQFLWATLYDHKNRRILGPPHLEPQHTFCVALDGMPVVRFIMHFCFVVPEKTPFQPKISARSQAARAVRQEDYVIWAISRACEVETANAISQPHTPPPLPTGFHRMCFQVTVHC